MAVVRWGIVLWQKVKWSVIGALVPTSALAIEPAPPPEQPDSERAAQPPSPPPPRRIDRVPNGCGSPGAARIYGGLRATATYVKTRGIRDGYGGRVDLDMVYTSRRFAGAFATITPIGIEGWGSSDGGGGSLPTSFILGLASPRFFCAVGGGWSWLVMDSISEDRNTSIGLLSPHGAASAGFWMDRVRIAADARAIYRWHFNTPSRSQVTLGLSLGIPLGN